MRFLFVSLCVLSVFPFSARAESTFLAQKTIVMQSSRSGEVLDRALADLRMVFQKFQLALDSNSQIVVPKKITGPADRPVMTVTVKKCILFMCETLELDAEVDAREVRGNCDRNYLITANLSRSNQKVRDVYDSLDTTICFKEGGGGKASLLLIGHAHHSPKYQPGFIQGELFKMLQMQVAPLVKAVQETLKEKE